LNGDKLKITIMFRGREAHRMNDGMVIINEVIEGLSNISKVDKEPTTEGRRISIVLSPLK
jgi:translation initiation factor IF-3